MSYKYEERIIGVGSHLPLEPMGNEELLEHCNLTDDVFTKERCYKWIDEKLGIKTRHSARNRNDAAHNFSPAEGCKNSEICAQAIRNAAENANINLKEIEMIIIATATPDYPVPGTSPLVQELLDIKECAVLDVRSACCGSLTAVITAIQYIRTGFFKTIAVCGCDVGSIFGNLDKDSPNYTRQDFVNAVMIGDGAGALILRGFTAEEEKRGIEILHFGLNSVGVGQKPGMWLPLGGCVYPGTVENANKGLQYFKHDYKAVMQHGPGLFFRALNDVLKQQKLSVSDIRLFVPHQANGSVAREASKYMGVSEDNIFQNFDKVGNTANASCMIALDQIATENKLAEGDLVLVGSAESTKWLYATILLRWTALKGEKKFIERKRVPFWRRMYANFVFFFVSKMLSFKRAIGY